MSVEFQITGEPFDEPEPTIQIGIFDEGSYFFTSSLGEAEQFANDLKSEIEYTRNLKAAQGNDAERLRLIAERAGFPNAKSWLEAERAKIQEVKGNVQP